MAQWHNRGTVNSTVVGSIRTGEHIFNIFIISGNKAKLPLNSHQLENSTESGGQNGFSLGYLCLHCYMRDTYIYFFFSFTQYHACSGVGRVSASIKTLRSPLSAEFWRHWELSSGAQRYAFASIPKQKIDNIEYFISSSWNQTLCIYSHTLVLLRHDYLILHKINKILHKDPLSTFNLQINFIWFNNVESLTKYSVYFVKRYNKSPLDLHNTRSERSTGPYKHR